jgi:hypothetical protein
MTTPERMAKWSQLCGCKVLSDNMLRQGFAIKTIKNAGMKTHMETSGK